MNVDFNNLRMQAAFALDRLTNTLNGSIMPEKEFAFHDDKETGRTKNFEGNILLSTDDIQKSMDDLRSAVWVLLCCYEEGNPNYRAVYEDVEKSGGLARFNEEEEEG